MRHFVIVGILIIVLTVLVYIGLDAAELMPVEASAQAVPIDWMWDIQVKAMSFLFALIVVPMVYSLFVFHRRKGEAGDGQHFEGNINLELAWTSIPLVVVVLFSVLGTQNLNDTLRRDPSAMVVKVTGIQWSWTFEYPPDENGVAVISSELHLPVNQPVLLRMTSTDVIHSFWVPEFRVKQDLVPGRFTELFITPTRVGDYEVRCAELCGTAHYSMIKPVIVSSEDEFTAWMAIELEKAKVASATPEGRGQKIYETYCKACHSLDGTEGTGPTWRGLYGHEVELSDGSVVVADDEYILNSIKNPAAQVVAGFPQPMNFNYQAVGITEENLQDIVAFIKTVK